MIWLQKNNRNVWLSCDFNYSNLNSLFFFFVTLILSLTQISELTGLKLQQN